MKINKPFSLSSRETLEKFLNAHDDEDQVDYHFDIKKDSYYRDVNKNFYLKPKGYKTKNGRVDIKDLKKVSSSQKEFINFVGKVYKKLDKSDIQFQFGTFNINITKSITIYSDGCF